MTESSVSDPRSCKFFESFSFGKYTYQKGKISKFPMLMAGIPYQRNVLHRLTEAISNESI
jgi:hypothetical protein